MAPQEGKQRIEYDQARPMRPAQRIPSGAFAQMSRAQISDIKAAFAMLDADRDGQVGPADLAQMLASLGQLPDERAVADMLGRLTSPLTFPVFLTEMSSKLALLPRREELEAACNAFDDDDSGQVDADELRRALVATDMPAADVDRAMAAFVRHRLQRDVFMYKDFVESFNTE
ncbi:uncharacterized protein V1510DRAFT_398083 [Dipodascopsis tothii]|uniref:uncharacterized protein n=1 Tax=Dipodascopsis tothii TaxID=44089 RepID=UPI0034CE567C